MQRRRLTDRRRTGAALATIVAAALVAALAVATLASPAGAGQHRRHQRAGKVRVNISEFAFHPRTLRVRRGTKVVFANTDSVPHTATRRGSFNTGRIRPRHSVSVRLKRHGVYTYYCTIHPFMHGKIVVR